MDQRSGVNADYSLKRPYCDEIKIPTEKDAEIPDMVELQKMSEKELLKLLAKQRQLHYRTVQSLLLNGYEYSMTDDVEQRKDFEETILPLLHQENLPYLVFPSLARLQPQAPSIQHHYAEGCVPVNMDIRDVNWELMGNLFQADVVTMDPPWNLSTEAPTRGVAIQYDIVTDLDIMENIANCLTHMQKESGAVFVWTINSKFDACMSAMLSLGYTFSDNITWVKTSTLHNSKRFAKGHGFYCQHGKENCLFFMKGKMKVSTKRKSVLFGERTGQSQKPLEFYQYIETLFPKKNYLEIFGRKNNLRNGWVTVGNELM